MKDCKIYYILILVLIFFIYQSNNDTIEGLEVNSDNTIDCLYIKEQDCSDNKCPRTDQDNPDFRPGTVEFAENGQCDQNCNGRDYTSTDGTCEDGYIKTDDVCAASVDCTGGFTTGDSSSCTDITGCTYTASSADAPDACTASVDCTGFTTGDSSSCTGITGCAYTPVQCEYNNSQHNNYCIRVPEEIPEDGFDICTNDGLDEETCLQLPIFGEKHNRDDGEIECDLYGKFSVNKVCEAKYDKMCKDLGSENCHKAEEYCKMRTATCTESAATSIAEDEAACAGVTELGDNTECNAVMTSDDSTTSACTYAAQQCESKYKIHEDTCSSQRTKKECDEYTLDSEDGEKVCSYHVTNYIENDDKKNQYCKKTKYQAVSGGRDKLVCDYGLHWDSGSYQPKYEPIDGGGENDNFKYHCRKRQQCYEAMDKEADILSMKGTCIAKDTTTLADVTDCEGVTELNTSDECENVTGNDGSPLCTYTPKEYTYSQLEDRTCNNEGVFDPVPYFYNIENAYSSCVGADCDITSEKREGIDDDFGYPSLDKFRCCTKQGTCSRSKHNETTNKANDICKVLEDPDPEREGKMLAYDRRMDLEKCKYGIRVSEIEPTNNLKTAQEEFDMEPSQSNETTLATAKSALETAQNEQLRNSDRYKILTSKPYDCLNSEVEDKCCRSKMQCDSTGWDDRNKTTGEISDEIVMKCPEGKYLDDSKNENLCEKAVCMGSSDEDTCCTSQAQCGNTPDPITHPSGTVGPTVPTRTAKPGETLAITDEDCGEGYKYNLNSLYQYCVGTVCNPLKVPEDKERCCVQDESTDTSENVTVDEEEEEEEEEEVVEETTTTTVSEEDNTMMYIGIGVVVLMILGGLGFLLMSDSGGKVKIKKIKAK